MGPITKTTPPPEGHDAIVCTDGSCPANPGPMGIGYYIQILDERDGRGYRIEAGYRLGGTGTNNRAEYLAIIFALRECLRQAVTSVRIFSDSLLAVNQINGSWKCSDRSLWPLVEEARGLLALFTAWHLEHIHREDNERADWLSKNPTEPILPPTTIEVDLTRKTRRKFSRHTAAMVRWWWKTHRCRNTYRLSRIFGGTPSTYDRIGNGQTYQDLTDADLRCL